MGEEDQEADGQPPDSRSHGCGPDVAAFDFDGTLVRGDSLLPFLSLVAGRAAVGRTVAALGPRIAAALVGVGQRDAVKAALVGELLAGVPAAVVAERGRGYAATLAARIRPDMASRVEWHRARGHRLVIVSASLAVYLEPLGALCGFDRVLATALEVGSDGLLTGRLMGANVRGKEKVLRLEEWLAGDSCRRWAYGDSCGDHLLLSAADHGHLVRRRQVVDWATTRARAGARARPPARDR